MHRHLVWIALGLAACSQPGTSTPTPSPGPSPSSPKQIGYIAYTNFQPDSGDFGATVSLFAGFHDFSSGLQPQALIPPGLPKLDPSLADTCQLGNNVTLYDNYRGLLLGALFSDLDAGDALRLKRNGALFASLPRQSVGTGSQPTYQYTLGANLDGLGAVTLEGTGVAGGFPAFSAPVLAPAQAFSTAGGPVVGFVLLSPPDPGAVSATSTFRWTNPTNDPNGVVILGISQKSPPVRFFCYARDDGSFDIPADFRTVLSQQNFTSGSVGAIQADDQTVTSGEALVVSIRLLGVLPAN